MHRKVRALIASVGASALVLPFASGAGAKDYPEKRITFIVGFAAGGFADSVARIIAQHVGKVLGQAVVVENRGGAASNIAARAVASASADGYTVLVSTTGLAVNATLYKTIDYSIEKDLTPVAIAVRAPETFSVNPSRPKTLKEFLEAAKSKRFSYGSAGVGTGSYLTWFPFFKDVAKVNVDHVPFKGGAPAMQATIGGQVDGLAATASGSTVTQVTTGKLTCLAVAAAKRYHLLPNCPSLAESGFPNFEGSSWVGFWVPAGTPADVIAALNKAINSVADDPKLADNLKRNGDLSGLSVEATDKFVKDEIATWGQRVKTAGIQID
ncbi:MAG: Bug family tripartite tricarboxylate transporter substrate binding protein [Bryobacteraceae bacterium]